MAEYAVVFARSARRELERLEVGVAGRIISRVEALADDPRPRGCVKLQAADDLRRIRVGGYRVIYLVDDDARLVDVRVVRHRSDAYTWRQSRAEPEHRADMLTPAPDAIHEARRGTCSRARR